MSKPFNALPAEVITDNLQAFNSAIQHGVSVIREELVTIYETAGNYLHKMVLPVNNFLKDHSQIDKELQIEITKGMIVAGEHCHGLEENY